MTTLNDTIITLTDNSYNTLSLLDCSRSRANATGAQRSEEVRGGQKRSEEDGYCEWSVSPSPLQEAQ